MSSSLRGPEVEEDWEQQPSTSADYRARQAEEEDGISRASSKRVVTVVRRKPRPLKVPKHVYLVTRKPKEGEKVVKSPIHDSLPPGYPLSPTDIIKRGPNGAIMKHSILGSIEDLQEMELIMNEDEEAGDGEQNEAGGDEGGPGTPKSIHSNTSRSLGRKSTRLNTMINGQEDTVPDPFVDRQRYVKALTDRLGKAREARMQEEKAEKELMEQLPMDEKLVLKKESQVLERWQRRLQDWEDVRNKVSKKVGRDPSSLVMNSVEEYREKSEELDVLQMAIPAKEKQGVHFWQMDLRNNSERYEMLGNLLSGLFCPVREKTIPPSIIRKPVLRGAAALGAAAVGASPPSGAENRSSKEVVASINNNNSISTSSNVPMAFKTARLSAAATAASKQSRQQQEQSQQPAGGVRGVSSTSRWKPSRLIQEAKQRYRKTLSNVRPHQVDDQLLEGLTLEMPDLFEWARESSAEYFREIDDFDNGGAAGEDGAGGGMTGTRTAQLFDVKMMAKAGEPAAGMDGKTQLLASTSEETLVATSSLQQSQQGTDKGPCIEVGPTAHLLFQAGELKELCKNEVVIRNTGSTAIFFSLKKQDRGTTLTDAYQAPGRDKLVASMQALFACHATDGMVLPNAEKTIVFTFKSDHTGVFAEHWLLTTTPKAHINVGLYDEAGKKKTAGATGEGGITTSNSKKKQAPPPRPSGQHRLFLQGVCTCEDRNLHHRLQLRQALSRDELTLQVRDLLISEVIRQVRTPRREEVIRARQREAFEVANRWLGAQYDVGRYDALQALFHRVRDYLLVVKHKQRLQHRNNNKSKKQHHRRVASGASSVGGGGMSIDGSLLSPEEVEAAVARKDEEEVVDDDDEEEWLTSTWDSSLGLILKGIQAIVKDSHRTILIAQDGYTLRSLPRPPSLLTKEQQQQDKKKAAGKSKSSKEAEAEAAAAAGVGRVPQVLPPPVPADHVVRDVLAMADELRLHILKSSLRPQDPPTQAAAAALSELGPRLVDAAARALEANGIRCEAGALPTIEPLPSAFSPEGEEAWAAIMKAGQDRGGPGGASIDGSKGGGGKAGGGGKDGGKAKGAAAAKKGGAASAAVDDASASAGATSSQVALYRYDLYQAIYNELCTASEAFYEQALQQDDMAARVYRDGKSLSVTCKAAMREEDVRGQCVLLQVDLDVSGHLALSADGEEWVLPPKARCRSPFTSAVQTIQSVLAMQPTSLIITSHLKQPPPPLPSGTSTILSGNASLGGPLSPSHASGAGSLDGLPPTVSLSCLMQPLSEVLASPLTFVPYVPTSGMFKKGLAEGGIFLLERLESEGLVPPLTPPSQPVSDDEEERLPTFENDLTKRRRIKREQKEREAAARPDAGTLLANVVDVFVADDPKSSLDESSPLLPVVLKGGRPVVVGPSLHHDLNHLSFYMERALTPRLAILGGTRVFDRLKMIDVLIDTVDHIFLGGALGINFLVAAGYKVGGSGRWVDHALQPVIKDLLNKAQRSPTNLILPVDAVIGEAVVTSKGVEPPPSSKEDEDDDEDDDDEDEEGDVESGVGISENNDSGPTGAVSLDPSTQAGSQQEEDEEDDPAAGFDYDYETQEVALSGGVDIKHFILDIGPESIKMLTDVIAESKTIFWDGLLGVAECASFQAGTRATTSSLMQLHDNTGAVVIVNGGNTAKWAKLFSGLEFDQPPPRPQQKVQDHGDDEDEDEEEGVGLEKVTGFSHICHEATLAWRILGDVSSPLIDGVRERDPREEELLLAEELRIKEIERRMREKEERERRRAEAEAAAEEEEEEEEEEEDDEEEEEEEDGEEEEEEE